MRREWRKWNENSKETEERKGERMTEVFCERKTKIKRNEIEIKFINVAEECGSMVV